MLRNKELKKLLIVELLLFSFSIFIGIIFNHFIDLKYKNEFIKNNGYIVSAIINTHPELEEEIIEAILSGKGDFISGKKILEKYGLDNSNLNYLEHFHVLEKELMIELIFFIFGIFFLSSISYLIFLKKQYQKIKHLGNYMDDVMNGKEILHIKDYEEGDFSTLKNDVYKLTTILKEGRNQSLNDKKELEQILSDISHQIRTPLTSMYVINDILRKEDIEKDIKNQFLDKNKVQLERIEWLVTSLLKMSRLDSGSVNLKLEIISIQKVIEEALEPLRIPMELKNIDINIIKNKNIEVLLDPNWTVEVFVNVFKNAYEHTNENGKITIEIIDNPLYTEVSIADTGNGIKKEELPHIFERFYTGSLSKESIGIGLNMAKKVMEKQKGEIYATSIEGKGTTFFIKFYKNIV